MTEDHSETSAETHAGIRATIESYAALREAGDVDGLVNLTARVLYGVGNWLRNLQTGYIRSYVLFLVLAGAAAKLMGLPSGNNGASLRVLSSKPNSRSFDLISVS